jgi:hypothetical protein
MPVTVPVIAIFTKRDARQTKVLAEAKDKASDSGRAALRQAKVHAKEAVDKWTDEQKAKLNTLPRSPSKILVAPGDAYRHWRGRVVLKVSSDMREANKDYEDFRKNLISSTEHALPSATLQALLTVVWVNNLSERSLWVFNRYVGRCKLSKEKARLLTPCITTESLNTSVNA